MSKVKICGLSRMEDIEAVNRALPDYIGFVFAPSRRRISIGAAAGLKERLNPNIEAVGVFVNENLEVIGEMCKSRIIDIVQLHGDEDGLYIRRLKELCGCRVIKAIGIGYGLHDLPAQPDLSDLSVQPDYMLFDTLSGQRGGAGRAFDLNVLKGYSGQPYFLAGGLSAENVAVAIRLLSPFCVDVSSGVETDGIKDAEKIEEFVYLVRGK